jgi:hypothetical protein
MNRTLNKSFQSYSQDVEPKIQYNSRLKRARYDGISIQRRPSLPTTSIMLSSIDNKSQQMILSAQVLPLSASLKQSNSILNKQSLINKLSSKRNSDIIQNNISVELKTNKK